MFWIHTAIAIYLLTAAGIFAFLVLTPTKVVRREDQRIREESYAMGGSEFVIVLAKLLISIFWAVSVIRGLLGIHRRG